MMRKKDEFDIEWVKWTVSFNDNGTLRKHTFTDGAEARRYGEKMSKADGVSDVKVERKG